jgi:hypothetical protein
MNTPPSRTNESNVELQNRFILTADILREETDFNSCLVVKLVGQRNLGAGIRNNNGNLEGSPLIAKVQDGQQLKITSNGGYFDVILEGTGVELFLESRVLEGVMVERT